MRADDLCHPNAKQLIVDGINQGWNAFRPGRDQAMTAAAFSVAYRDFALVCGLAIADVAERCYVYGFHTGYSVAAQKHRAQQIQGGHGDGV